MRPDEPPATIPAGALAGRVLAIPGATGALGPHVAAALTAAGASVALAGRSRDRLEPVAADLPADRALCSAVELLDEAAVRSWAAEAVEHFGHVDGVIHLVGGWRGGTPLATAPLEDWTFLQDQLVRTTQHVTRAFHDALRASPHGRFVLVSARQAVQPSQENAAYAAAKAAAEAWTLAFADALADVAATANVVAVNALVTPQQRDEQPDEPFAWATRVEDVAATIAFLCSDAARTMHGRRVILHA